MFNTLIFLAFLCREQPPSGGCVLKLLSLACCCQSIMQPPSGGCVLKQWVNRAEFNQQNAATFGWLCVETMRFYEILLKLLGSHLRVAVCWNIKHVDSYICARKAATFGWLCVETQEYADKMNAKRGSHLRVAVCWNNSWWRKSGSKKKQPPSGGCVLKHR